MEYLPNEVLQVITNDLDKSTFRTCLTVNKAWYSIFIKLLYEEVIVRHENQLQLFLTSFSLHPRNMDHGKHIKKLNMFAYTPDSGSSYHDMSIFENDVGFTYQNMCIDFIKAIPHLPNLNELVICHFPQFILEKSCGYMEDCGDTLFYLILTQFSSLTSLKYDCVSLNTHLSSSFDKQHFPHISKLDLHILHFYSHDSLYIKNTFTALTELNISICHIHNKNNHMFDAFMRIETLVTLQVACYVIEIDTLYILWDSATSSTFIPDMNVTYESEISRLAVTPAKVVINNYPESKSRRVSYITSVRFNQNRYYQGFLISIKDSFDKVTICGCVTGKNRINSYKHVGASLGSVFTPPNDAAGFDHLRNLTYSYLGVSDFTFRSIEERSPNLQSLKLSHIVFMAYDGSDSIVEMKLPNTNMKTLELIAIQQRVLVIRDQCNLPLLSWHYNDQSNKTDVVEGDDIVSVIQKVHPNQQLIILRCSTLEHVYIERIGRLQADRELNCHISEHRLCHK